MTGRSSPPGFRFRKASHKSRSHINRRIKNSTSPYLKCSLPYEKSKVWILITICLESIGNLRFLSTFLRLFLLKYFAVFSMLFSSWFWWGGHFAGWSGLQSTPQEPEALVYLDTAYPALRLQVSFATLHWGNRIANSIWREDTILISTAAWWLVWRKECIGFE